MSTSTRTRRLAHLLPFLVGTLLAGCQAAAPDGTGPSPPPATGKGGGTGQTGGTSGGGTATGGNNTPGSTGGSGPATGSGGSSAGSGGRDGSGGASAAGGTGGSSSMGSGGARASDAGSGDSAPGSDGGGIMPPAGARPPKPSAGCGKANPTVGMRTIMTSGRAANYFVNIPAGYDPSKPLPLGFAFHGHSNGLCTGECAGFRNLNAVTFFPKSLAAGWEDNPEPLTSNLKFFEDLVALAKNEFCVDENRIFVAGVSSGGQFVEHLACKYGDWLWSVSPVAAFVDRGVDMNCKGTPPVNVIHGVTDRAGNFGQSVAELYAKRNGCAVTPPAGLAMARMEMMAAFSARRAEYRCLDWQGCTANPVRYCLSSQITYSGLTHGWPRVGGTLIGEFLSTLK